jgi:pimeloyl-ACP methyl ester carboxylesterase
VKELTYRRGPELLPARLYQGEGRDRPRPAWVLLHGLTYYGRAHPSLDRFARALAASGATVLVPEIPEWSRLRVAPTATGPSIEGAIEALIANRLAPADRIGVFGFSFGATQALAALADPALGARVRSLVAWGGYCDLHRLFRFGITGEHEFDGVETRVEPDPYGAWIMGANYVTGIPGHEEHAELAGALHELALESGRRGIYARDAAYDPLKAQLRERLPRAQREAFRLFAPLTGEQPPRQEQITALIDGLAGAALRADPLLNPQPLLPKLAVRTLIAHGRDDRLVPYTESLRLGRTIPESARAGCSITSLFAHSTGAARYLNTLTRARETTRFCALLHRLLQLV